MDYHMQFVEFLSLLQKCGQSYAISEIFLLSHKNVDYHMQFLNFLTKTCNIILNFWNFFPCSKNVDYHMQFIKFLYLLQKHGLSYAISEFLSLLQKRGLSYAISEPSNKDV